MTHRTLTILLTSLTLAFGATALSGCCCGDMSEISKVVDEAKKEAEKAETDKGDEEADDKGDEEADEDKKDDEDKKADKDDEDKKDDGDKKDDEDKKGDVGGSVKVSELTPEDLKKRLEALDWNIVSESKAQDNFFTYGVMKGQKIASVQLQTSQSERIAKLTEKALAKSEGAVVERDGKHMLYVFVVQDQEAAQTLLNKILGK